MAVGFEARARITADVSGFVAAQRQAAQAAGTLATAVTILNGQLRQTQRLAADSASSLRTIAQASKTAAQAQGQNASAARQSAQASQQAAQAYMASNHGAQQAAAAMNTNTAAATRNTQSLQGMGREMARLSAQRRTLMQIQSNQGQLNQSESAALQTLRDRLRQLGQQYARLGDEQRQAVDGAREMARAQTTVQQTSATMAREIRSAATETARLGRESQTAQSQIRELDNSLFAMRSALGDVEGALMGITSNVRRAAVEMATVFSEQEMAIANLSRVTQATAIDLANMTSQFRDMASEIPLAFDELARIGQLGAQVGIAEDQLANFTQTVALFAATTDVAADDAALLFARIVEMTSIEPTQIQNLGAAVSELGSNSAATEGEILKTVESIATAGSQAGLSSDMILGLGSAMASLRIQPELARGALQRVFLKLGEAVQSSGAEMQRLTEITGQSGQELRNLQDTSPDEFFLRIAEGLGSVSDSGQDLIPIIRELGIINTRDVDVLARLAGNYGLLADQVDLAGESFARGTFLQQESSRIFNTLTARVQLLKNAWQEFLFNVVTALGPFITSVVDAATAVLQWVNASDIAPFVVWGAAITGTVTTVAALGATIAGVAQGVLAFRGVMLITNQALAANAAATTASAAANTVAAGASARLAASETVRATIITRTTVATTTLSVATLAMGAAMTRAAVATRAFIVAHPAGIFLAAAAAVAGLATAWSVLNSDIRRTSTEVFEANQTLVDAVGGLEAFQNALVADTEALNTSSGAITYRTDQVGAMDAADRDAAASSQELANNQGFLQSQLEGTSASARELTNSTYNSVSALEGQTVAVGESVRALAAQQVEMAALESGIFDTAESFDIFRQSAVDLGQTLDTELADPGAGVAELREEARLLREELTGIESAEGQEFVLTLNDMNDAMGRVLTLGGLLGPATSFDESEQSAREAADGFDAMADGLETSSEATRRAQRASEGLGKGLTGASDSAEAAAQGYASAAEAAQAAAESFGSVVEAVRGATDPMAALREEGEALALSWDETFSSLAGSMADSMTFAFELAGLTSKGLSDTAAAFIAENRDIFGQHMGELSEMTEEELSQVDQVLRFMAGDMDTELGEMFNNIQDSAAATGDTMGVDMVNGIIEGIASGEISVQAGMAAIRMMAEGEIGIGDYEIDPELAEEDALAAQIQGLVEHMEQLIEDGQYDFDLEADGEDAEAEAEETRREIEDTAISSEPVFHMDTDGEDAEQGALNTEDFVVTTADLADPVFNPRTDGETAKSQMSSARSSVEKTASSSSPTFKARTSGSQAFSDMSSIMGSLRSMASTIWVTVRGVAGGGGLAKSASRADGGWVGGPGGPRQDKVPLWASPNEFVVNAQDARDYAPLLQWINDQKGRGGRAGDFPRTVASKTLSPMGMDSGLTRSLGRSLPPIGVRQSQATGSSQLHERIAITVNNTYPQAEPTSTTVNRSLQYAATLEGLSS